MAGLGCVAMGIVFRLGICFCSWIVAVVAAGVRSGPCKPNSSKTRTDWHRQPTDQTGVC